MTTEIIKSKLLPSFENVGIAHAVRNGNWVFISGQIPLDPEGNIVGKAMCEPRPCRFTRSSRESWKKSAAH